MNLSSCFRLVLLASAFLQTHAENVQSEACDLPKAQNSDGSHALLQVSQNKENKKTLPDLTGLLRVGQHSLAEQNKEESQQCSYELQGDEDGSQFCAALKGTKYKSGADATLDEAGYQETAKLCCHHEMSLFVRRG